MNPTKLQQEIFEKYQNGSKESLILLIDSIIPDLFDCSMRMTGQVERSWAGCVEVEQSILASITIFETFEDLIVCLFSTLKNFNSDIWYDDTQSLENNLIDKDFHQLKELEKSIHSLPPKQKEIFLLQHRYHFSWEQISKILRRGQEKIEEEADEATKIVADSISINPNNIFSFMKDLPNFPLPEHRTHSTVVLSEVMEQLKETRRGDAIKKQKWWLWVILLCGVLVWLAYVKS